MIKKLFDKYREIIMYLIFGVLTTLVAWVSYAIFTKVIPEISFAGITIAHTTSANVLSWICGVIFAYVTNKIWVFESKSWKPSVAFKELWQFVASRLITGFIEWFGLPLLIHIGFDYALFGVDGMLAKILVSVIVVILNYVFSKLLIFKGNKKDPNAHKDEHKPTDEIIDDILDDIRKK